MSATKKSHSPSSHFEKVSQNPRKGLFANYGSTYQYKDYNVAIQKNSATESLMQDSSNYDNICQDRYVLVSVTSLD